MNTWCRGCLFFLSLTCLVHAEGPQPPLPEQALIIGTTPLRAEVAATAETRERGLMYREKLEEGHGMLFVFSTPQPMAFWMRNTRIPLSIAYINTEGVIREIYDLRPLDETAVRSVFGDVLYALEVPQGWFMRHKILPGDRVIGLPQATSAP